MLPFMQLSLVTMGLFFFAASIWQLRDVEREIRHERFDLARELPTMRDAAAPLGLETRARLLLESDVVGRRYHQANAIILARLWTRYSGFLTGMVLALVGSVFVLGRLQESPTRLTGEGGGWKASLDTSSPGLVLAFLGTALMAIALSVEFRVETRDVAVYLTPGTTSAMPPATRIDTESLIDQKGADSVTTPGDASPLRCDRSSPFEEDREGCPQ